MMLQGKIQEPPPPERDGEVACSARSDPPGQQKGHDRGHKTPAEQQQCVEYFGVYVRRVHLEEAGGEG